MHNQNQPPGIHPRDRDFLKLSLSIGFAFGFLLFSMFQIPNENGEGNTDVAVILNLCAMISLGVGVIVVSNIRSQSLEDRRLDPLGGLPLNATVYVPLLGDVEAPAPEHDEDPVRPRSNSV